MLRCCIGKLNASNKETLSLILNYDENWNYTHLIFQSSYKYCIVPINFTYNIIY